MADRLEEYAKEGQIKPATVERMRVLGRESCDAVVDLLVPLKVSENQLRDFLDLREDTAARRGATVADVLTDDEIEAVRRREIGRSDKIKALKACLRRLRYPQLSAALDTIELLKREMELPRSCTLELPENLEGDEVVVTLRASSVAQLRSRVDALQRALGGERLDPGAPRWFALSKGCC